MATLKEIAARTGLSVPSVVQILGKRGHLYREETRRKVLDAALDLGYKPNASAKAMRSGRFGGIGLLLSTLRNRSDLAADFLQSVQAALSERDLNLSIAALPDQKLTSKTYLPKILRELAVDGLIVNYTHFIPADMVEMIQSNSIPAVWINTKRETDCVYINDLQGGRLATEQLLRLGHRRIIYIDFQTDYSESHVHYSAHDRFAGYSEAMQHAGLPPRAVRHERVLTPAERTAAVIDLLKSDPRPTALVCYSAWNDAMPAQIAARECGLTVPADLSIVTFANWLFDGWGQPITTVMLPLHAMGTAAVHMLLQKMDGHASPALPSIALDVSLQQGSTTGPAPQA